MNYIVKPGDTLHSVARRFGVSLNELIAANPQLEKPQLIYPGQLLTIPGANPPADLPDNAALHSHSTDTVSRFHRFVPRLAEPYPEIKVQGRNLNYALMLQDAYAGRVSELTAIMQYTYHHMIMENISGWQDVAELESGISIVEMEHLEILGELIIQLGGVPRYHDGRQHPWHPDYVAYCNFDPCAQLRADIAAEQAAIADYQRLLHSIHDSNIQAIIRRIILDEEHHLRLFSEKLTRCHFR